LKKAVAAVFPKRKRTIQIYSARHACSARWLASGMTEYEVSTLLGNDTITLKQYGGGSKKRAAARTKEHWPRCQKWKGRTRHKREAARKFSQNAVL